MEKEAENMNSPSSKKMILDASMKSPNSQNESVMSKNSDANNNNFKNNDDDNTKKW